MAIGATTIWRARPSGNNANGGGFDPGLSGAGTDFSKQNAAQVVFNGTTVRATTAGVGATITLVGYTATAADIGNVLNITGGTNFITGRYAITAQGGTTWTLDRNCTTGAGAAMTGNMGGGWADYWTNCTTGAAILVPGNIVYVLGSGIPNPSSYTYDYTFAGGGTGISLTDGDATTGKIRWLNDPDTPNYKAPPDTTGGMPVTQVDGTFMSVSGHPIFCGFEGLYFVQSNNLGGGGVIGSFNNQTILGCVQDQMTKPFTFIVNNGAGCIWIGCEAFSSTGGGSFSGSPALLPEGGITLIHGCNIHDVNSAGIVMVGNNKMMVSGCIVAKCAGNGIECDNNDLVVSQCTIDGNGGHGIYVDSNSELQGLRVFNNIISNNTGVGKYGLTINSGTTATNDRLKAYIDYNTFYNNTANYNAISAGPHDTALGVTPYVASATENYALA
jgi:Right handed beta helix region